MKKTYLGVLVLILVLLVGCGGPPNSMQVEQQKQEALQAQSVNTVGMPAVKNFREKRIMRDIIELRDQTGYVTYGYVQNITTGKFVYVGQGIGYPIPYSTQYTNPQKIQSLNGSGYYVMAQADPNGLYSPASAEGTWWMMKDPKSDEVRPCYFETRLNVFPFKLDQ